MPELTKKFFEKILRESEKLDDIQVTKVKVSDENVFGNHFCSQVNRLEIHVKISRDQQKIFQLVIKCQGRVRLIFLSKGMNYSLLIGSLLSPLRYIFKVVRRLSGHILAL